MIPSLARSLAAVHEQRQALEAQIAALLEAHPLSSVLTSMPGTGVRTAAVLLVTVGDGTGSPPTPRLTKDIEAPRRANGKLPDRKGGIRRLDCFLTVASRVQFDQAPKPSGSPVHSQSGHARAGVGKPAAAGVPGRGERLLQQLRRADHLSGIEPGQEPRNSDSGSTAPWPTPNPMTTRISMRSGPHPLNAHPDRRQRGHPTWRRGSSRNGTETAVWCHMS